MPNYIDRLKSIKRRKKFLKKDSGLQIAEKKEKIETSRLHATKQTLKLQKKTITEIFEDFAANENATGGKINALEKNFQKDDFELEKLPTEKTPAPFKKKNKNTRPPVKKQL